jgi:hypothetical protein
MAWLTDGMARLPAEVGQTNLSADYLVVALIYEFEQATRDHPCSLKSPSALQGRAHLEKAGLWPPWRKRS